MASALGAPEPPMLSELIHADRAWLGPSLDPHHYVMTFPEACLVELMAVQAELAAAPVPTLLLLPEQFDLRACTAWMKGIRDQLDNGIGFAVLERLPLERMTEQQAIDLYWLLANLIEPPVAQEWRGTPIMHVRHEAAGDAAEARGTATLGPAPMHTDSSMGEAPPNYLGLLCLRQAKSGGLSSIASLLAAHNHLLRTSPEILARLYRDYYRDHKDFQAADAAAKNFRPIFAWEGRLRTRLSFSYIFDGYRRTGRVLDEIGSAALQRLEAFLCSADHRVDFMLRPGQILFNNNNLVAHSRSQYEDHDAPELRRHLVRLWLRAGDRRQFRG